MTWFKENKFLGGLIVVTVILAGVILYFGMKFQGDLDEKISEVEAKETELKKMKGLDPFPTPENAKAKTDSLKALIADANKMQAQFLAYKPASVEPIAVNQFSALLQDTNAKVVDLFEGKIALPDTFYLGFEIYKSQQLPEPESTGELAYELAAIEWLMTEMEKAKVTEVSNIVRHQIPSEKGETWDGAGKPAAGKKRPPRGAKTKARGPSLPKVANRMPIEITFKGPESAVRQVLSAMADTDQYFFDTRIARFANDAPIPTKPRTRTADAGPAEPAEESDDGFGDVVGADEPDAPAEDAPAVAQPERQILDHIAGSEDITAYLRVDLLLFTDDQQFPVIK